MCHLVLALPVVGLVVFWIWPLSVAIPAYLAVLAVSGVTYRAIMAAMQSRVVTGREGLLHEDGVVVSSPASGCCVRVHGELWQATSPESLRPKDHVQVAAVDGLTLRVHRLP